MRRFTILWIVLLSVSISATRINAEQSTPSLRQIGRGDIQSVVWHPQNTYILVTTVTGAWIYTPDLKDLAHLPDAHMATLSPDGRYIAGVDDSHRLRLWDGNTFEPITIPDTSRFRRIWTLAWSNDSRYIAVSGNTAEDMTYAWDVTHNMEVVVATRNAGDDLVWSPQGSILAIHNFPDGQFVLMGIGKSVQHQILTKANHISFQDENHILVIQTTDVNVEATRWNIATGEPLAKTWFLPPLANYSHSGQSLAVGNPGNVSILNAETNENQISISDRNFGWVEVMAWSHNDHWLAAGAYNFSRSQAAGVLLINTLTHQVEHQLSGLWQSVIQLAWSSDDRFLAAVDARQQLVVYDVSSGEIQSSSQAHTLVGQTLAWNSDGTILAVAASSTGVSLWDTQHMQPIREFHDDGSPVTSIKWQPHGNYIAAQEHEILFTYPFVGRLLKTQVWDASDSENTSVISRFKHEPDAMLDFLDWSADGKQLAAIVGKVLYLWDVTTGKTETRFVSDYGYLGLQDIRWSPSGHYIIMAMDGIGTGGSYIYSIEANNAGLAFASLGRGTLVWSPRDELVSLSWGGWGDPTPPTSIEVGLSRLVAPDFTSRATDTGWQGFTLKGLTQNTQQGFLSPNGHYAAAVDGAGSGMVWDATTGLPITMLADTAQVIWSPDETQLAVQRLDGSIWLLDSKGVIRQQLPISASLQKPEGSFFWSPDSRQLAHLHNGVIDLWQLN